MRERVSVSLASAISDGCMDGCKVWWERENELRMISTHEQESRADGNRVRAKGLSQPRTRASAASPGCR